MSDIAPDKSKVAVKLKASSRVSTMESGSVFEATSSTPYSNYGRPSERSFGRPTERQSGRRDQLPGRNDPNLRSEHEERRIQAAERNLHERRSRPQSRPQSRHQSRPRTPAERCDDGRFRNLSRANRDEGGRAKTRAKQDICIDGRITSARSRAELCEDGTTFKSPYSPEDYIQTPLPPPSPRTQLCSEGFERRQVVEAGYNYPPRPMNINQGSYRRPPPRFECGYRARPNAQPQWNNQNEKLQPAGSDYQRGQMTQVDGEYVGSACPCPPIICVCGPADQQPIGRGRGRGYESDGTGTRREFTADARQGQVYGRNDYPGRNNEGYDSHGRGYESNESRGQGRGSERYDNRGKGYEKDAGGREQRDQGVKQYEHGQHDKKDQGKPYGTEQRKPITCKANDSEQYGHIHTSQNEQQWPQPNYDQMQGKAGSNRVYGKDENSKSQHPVSDHYQRPQSNDAGIQGKEGSNRTYGKDENSKDVSQHPAGTYYHDQQSERYHSQKNDYNHDQNNGFEYDQHDDFYDNDTKEVRHRSKQIYEQGKVYDQTEFGEGYECDEGDDNSFDASGGPYDKRWFQNQTAIAQADADGVDYECYDEEMGSGGKTKRSVFRQLLARAMYNDDNFIMDNTDAIGCEDDEDEIRVLGLVCSDTIDPEFKLHARDEEGEEGGNDQNAVATKTKQTKKAYRRPTGRLSIPSGYVDPGAEAAAQVETSSDTASIKAVGDSLEGSQYKEDDDVKLRRKSSCELHSVKSNH